MHALTHTTPIDTATAPLNAQEAHNSILASLSTAGLLATLGIAALFLLATPGQPLAALLGLQGCGVAG